METYQPVNVVSGRRSIQDGRRYDGYFPLPEERDRVIIKDGEVTDTVQLMEKVVWKYIDDLYPSPNFGLIKMNQWAFQSRTYKPAIQMRLNILLCP